MTDFTRAMYNEKEDYLQNNHPVANINSWRPDEMLQVFVRPFR